MTSLRKLHLLLYLFIVFVYTFVMSTDLSCLNENSEEIISNFNVYDELCFNYTNINETETVIEDLKVIVFHDDALTISWKVTGENATVFSIEWFLGNRLIGSGNYTFLIPEDGVYRYLITNLKACSKYKIVVTALVSGPTESKETTGVTSKVQPGSPLILKADPDEMLDALNITWKSPKVGGSCVKYYTIAAEATIHEERHVLLFHSTRTQMIMRSLRPCTSYLITIQPFDQDGIEGLFSVIQSTPTLKRAPKPPTLANGIGVPPFVTNSSAIILNWNIIDRENNCSVDSVHTYCQYSYTEGYGFPLNNGRTNRSTNRYHTDIVRLEIGNLSPFTKYICWGWLMGGGETSELSLPVPVVTRENAPSAPTKFKLLDEETFTFSWEPPVYMPGRLRKYRITFTWVPLYPVPDLCTFKERYVIDNLSPVRRNFTWKDGEGFSNYTVHIDAHTVGGWGPISSLISFQSLKKGVPGPVTDLVYETVPSMNDSSQLETTLTWYLPCHLRGTLKYFDVFIFGTKQDSENHTITSLIIVKEYKKNDLFTINLGELKAQYYYLFEVAAVTEEVNQTGLPSRHFAEYPPGIPPNLPIDYLKSITLSPEKIQRTTSSAEVLLPLFPNTNGEIKYYAAIVSLLGSGYKPEHTRYTLSNGEWLNISSWKDSMEQDFKLPYQVTEPYWNPYPNYVIDYGSIKAIKYKIGDDITCPDVSLATSNRLYCNGPLKPDTWYEVRIRAFTNGGYSDSPPIAFKTDSEVSIFLIIGLVFGILMLGICAALLLAGKSYFKNKDKDMMPEDDFDKDDIRSRRLGMIARSHSNELRRYDHSTE